jgi:hypothetical protein
MVSTILVMIEALEKRARLAVMFQIRKLFVFETVTSKLVTSYSAGLKRIFLSTNFA